MSKLGKNPDTPPRSEDRLRATFPVIMVVSFIQFSMSTTALKMLCRCFGVTGFQRKINLKTFHSLLGAHTEISLFVQPSCSPVCSGRSTCDLNTGETTMWWLTITLDFFLMLLVWCWSINNAMYHLRLWIFK